MSLSAASEYGVIHAGYRDDLQAAEVSITGSSLTGIIVCSQELNGTEGIITVACYDSNGRMLRADMTAVTLSNGGEFDFTVDPTCAEVKLFVLSGGSWAALCPATVRVS